jgi:hypothetical protein
MTDEQVAATERSWKALLDAERAAGVRDEWSELAGSLTPEYFASVEETELWNPEYLGDYLECRDDVRTQYASIANAACREALVASRRTHEALFVHALGAALTELQVSAGAFINSEARLYRREAIGNTVAYAAALGAIAAAIWNEPGAIAGTALGIVLGLFDARTSKRNLLERNRVAQNAVDTATARLANRTQWPLTF